MPASIRPMRGAMTLALALGATALAHQTALAHASLEVSEAPAESTYKAVLRVPHGCDGQPTTALTVTMPEGFIDVKPMPKAGWTLETTRADYDTSYELWGDTVSSGVTEIRWTGGNLPDDFYDEFVFRGRIMAFEPGTALPFKAVQTCPDGEVAWTEISAAGQNPHDLTHPAPTVTIADASGTSHADHGATTAGTSGAISIDTPWMRQPPPGAAVAGGYMTIENDGAEEDRLVAVSVPFAEQAEVHEMAMTDGVMTMQKLAADLAIPAGESVALAPGGYHLMFMKVSDAPKAGETVNLTLTFERAGTVTVPMQVAPIGASAPTGHGASGNGGAHKH